MNVKEIIKQLTLEEKAGLCSGADFWRTKAVERLGVPQMMVSDGPHGLRKQSDEADHLGVNESIKAVCFPTGVTVASSFDKDLIRVMGETIGKECQAENLGAVLGPAMNIKRSPLCGRNFEYFSEDPYLSGTMAASQINGIQSQGVGTSIKHFVANNQEHRRMSSNSVIDERTLREIYLEGFEIAVKEAKPWTVMCSYNVVNGVYASENKRLLTEILRDEWGFDGFVVSDWGAVNDRVEGVKAGMDLEMPSSFGVNDQKIIDAVKSGVLSEDDLNRTVEDILTIVDRYQSNRKPESIFDRDADHEIARNVARESMVLLKNTDVLPLRKDDKVAFIGEFAKKPRFQGGGSSHINTHKTSNAVESVCKYLGISQDEFLYADGYSLAEDIINQKLIDQAIAVAKQVDKVVIFAGLPDAYESEGYDRTHMRLPESHDALIEAIAQVNEHVVVVLHNGSPVEMPWIANVSAVLEAYLAGQSVGQATVDILYGEVNPSGRLAETFPKRLEDNPSYLFYVGEKDTVEYREGVFVGYRYYDAKNMDVLFPFGYGLSYTSFEYKDINISTSKMSDQETVTVSVRVTNTGDCKGKEVVQCYVAPPKSLDVIRPVKELKGFEKVELEVGESKTVEFTLDKRSFAYFNTTINDWYVPSGDYEIVVGKSSRDLQLSAHVEIESTVEIPMVCTANTLIGDLLQVPEKAKVLEPFMQEMEKVFQGEENDDIAAEAITKEMKEAMFRYMPLRNFISFGNGQFGHNDLEVLLKALNN
jgi:beta-glucosidase